MQLGITSMGAKVRGTRASTAAAAFKQLPGLKKVPATGAGVLSSVTKAAADDVSKRDRIGGFVRGAGTGAAIGAGVGGISATNFMTKKPGVFARLFAQKPTWGGAVKRVGAGIIAGGALGGGIGAMTAKRQDRTKAANVLGPTVWGERSSPYAGNRTNPFCKGILKGANVLGQTRFGERESPFARAGRTNPFAKAPLIAKEAAEEESEAHERHEEHEERETAREEREEHRGQGRKRERFERRHMKLRKAAAEKWIQGAIKHPGALHRQLHVPQGEKIPAAKLHAAAEHGGVLGRRARLAETLKGLSHHKHASSRDGAVDGMAAAMEEMLAGSVDPYRGFTFAEKVRAKVAEALSRN